jgi:hypothetical protein
MAELRAIVQEHRHEFVVALFQRRIGVDIEHLEVESQLLASGPSAFSMS